MRALRPSKFKPNLLAAALSVSVIGSPAVAAQDDGAFALEEIIVTAQKRADVPISVGSAL